ncbi:MAG: FeoA family protein [Sulfuricellaceae bacterium]|nr:FeoA family protein [Sulfuricellaceae bacterium]
MSTVRLSTLKPGESATIAALHTEEALYHRLAAMGFRIGKRIDLIRRAKFAGPLHVRIGTTDVMLRRSDAQRIAVNPAAKPVTGQLS